MTICQTDLGAVVAPSGIEVEEPAMPTPAVPVVLPTPPCYGCGDEYLTNTRITGSNGIIAGCECSLCAPANARGASDTPTPLTCDQAVTVLNKIVFSLGAPVDPYMNPRTITVAMCPGCTSALRASIATFCDWCDQHDGTEANAHIRLTDVAGTPIEVARVTFFGGFTPNNARSANSDFIFTDLSGGEMIRGNRVCDSCYNNAPECDDCGELNNNENAYDCHECEQVVCSSCWDSSHYRHRDTASEERPRFYPRFSIRQALDTFARPGSTILSTRALGIEIETARGSAHPVIQAEVNGAFPILAAVGSDSSVRGRNAVEFRLLPVRGATAEYAIRSMAQWCRDAGYAPDSSAGVHMHVDCIGLTAPNVWRAFTSLLILEGVLFSHADSARLASTYCSAYGTAAQQMITTAITHGSIRRDSFFDASVLGVNSRYRSINAQSYSQHQTLEVRVFDSNHAESEVGRFTDAAAIIAGAVDFAISPEWPDFITGHGTDRAANAIRLLGAMASNNHITTDTFARAAARTDSRTLVAA